MKTPKPYTKKEAKFWNDEFPITSLCRADLKGKLPLTAIRRLTDAKMRHLASKMADDYCEQLFWGSLEILARYEL